MLLAIFIILIVVGVIVSDEMMSSLMVGIGLAVTGVLGVFLIGEYVGINAEKDRLQQEYQALVYKAENIECRDELGINKLEIVNEIQEWNENLAYKQKLQNDLWLGVFIPDIYDNFQLINYDTIK